ncbi:MAG: hypothetical protein Q7R73_00420 [bacterium]|nr:hypothetical protein [bacterium]
MIRKSAVLLCAMLILGACGSKKEEVIFREKCQKIVAHKYYRATSFFSDSDVKRYIVLEDGSEVEVRGLFSGYDVDEKYCVSQWAPRYPHNIGKGGTPG